MRKMQLRMGNMASMLVPTLIAPSRMRIYGQLNVVLVFIATLSLSAFTAGDQPMAAALIWRPLLTCALWLLITWLARGLGMWSGLSFFVIGAMIAPQVSALISLPFRSFMSVDSLATYVIPFTEESIKLLPVALFLWCREQPFMTAADAGLLGLLSGTGFQITEDLFRFVASGRGAPNFTWSGMGPYRLFPHIDDGLPLFVGHGVWTGVAALGLYGTLKYRHRLGRWMWVLAAAGSALAIFEHAAVNHQVGRGFSSEPAGWFDFAYGTIDREGQLSVMVFAGIMLGSALLGVRRLVTRREPVLDLRPPTSWSVNSFRAYLVYVRSRVGAGIALDDYQAGRKSWEAVEPVLIGCAALKQHCSLEEPLSERDAT
ncbi:MAG: PrsW family intramembrane metalloprotease [Actinobacteria bacterium]|nr:PrsW family intramembrane metalloprotease [Actinomycetota bacterium]NCG38782.1 PrsW family intramembrane metalloprotease [Actinomycetota bacterium]